MITGNARVNENRNSTGSDLMVENRFHSFADAKKYLDKMKPKYPDANIKLRMYRGHPIFHIELNYDMSKDPDFIKDMGKGKEYYYKKYPERRK